MSIFHKNITLTKLHIFQDLLPEYATLVLLPPHMLEHCSMAIHHRKIKCRCLSLSYYRSFCKSVQVHPHVFYSVSCNHLFLKLWQTFWQEWTAPAPAPHGGTGEGQEHSPDQTLLPDHIQPQTAPAHLRSQMEVEEEQPPDTLYCL